MRTSDQAITFVLQAEGILSDDPADPGGLTKFGHSARAWPATLACMPSEIRCAMPADVAALTYQQACVGYYWAYWVKFGCDTLPPALALLVLDTAVNGGRPIEWLQRSLHVSVDGVLGPVTRAAAWAQPIPETCAEYQSWHAAYLTSLPGWHDFGAINGRPLGWTRRLFTMLLNSQRMT